MIQKLFSVIINALYLITIIFIVIMVTVTALLNKTNLALQTKTNLLTGNVVKQDIPILATGSATLQDFIVEDGQHVEPGDKLFSWSQTINATTIASQTVTAPTAGIVKFTKLKPGDTVQANWKIIDIYTDDGPRLLVYLTQDQYNSIRNIANLQAYSTRLDQSLTVVPKMFQADTVNNGTAQEKIGVYFDFRDAQYATSLLQNESLKLLLPQPKTVGVTDMLHKISFLSQ
ncbi:MAG TPA: HlyD family efflux transporter periplasmic adaptor subunit [Candidatus Sulfotelmatobacter sp.]|nr:HlyD family efflux transporter periplasmic adaptor subunit [Candidatus Sulfotelmatobacter sp.]